MLARNAESLYWIGRYVERADDTARILDVSVHQLLEDATVDVDTAARTLLRVLGVEATTDEPLDAWSLTELAGYSTEHAGSIVASVASARENARLIGNGRQGPLRSFRATVALSPDVSSYFRKNVMR